LSVATFADHRHKDVLRRHEGKLFHDASRDDLGVDHQAITDVHQGLEEAVGCEEGFGQHDPPVGGIIEGSLHPLGRRGVRRIGGQ